jgi:HAD superfamily hydrolase (TIGR01549 family)
VIEIVIFDLDGTLVHLPIDYEVLFEEFKQIMHVDNVRPVVTTVSRADEKTRKLVFEAWDKAELAVSEKITMNEEGMKPYRKFMDKQKVLVTLQGKAVVKSILKQSNLTFDFVVTREDALFRVDQLMKAINQLKSEPKNVLFVGNADSDADAAEKIGCQFQRIK